jgi:hypothetical protein
LERSGKCNNVSFEDERWRFNLLIAPSRSNWIVMVTLSFFMPTVKPDGDRWILE